MNAQQINRAEHWERVYQTKADRETSWYQDDPQPSLDLICAHAPQGGRIVDIGGGNSNLASLIARQGFDVTVLDISAAAIERGKARAGDLADRLHWIVGDVTTLADLGEYDLWHDRAVFHFLVDPADRRRYVALASQSVKRGGWMILSGFSLSGPEQCSGLPVFRCEAGMLAREFAGSFDLVRSFDDVHTTPWGKPQAFIFAMMRRTMN